jgi:nitrate reductase NapE component
MLKDNNPTTRKYPRTIKEAFPDDKENSQWLEHYTRIITPQDITFWSVVVITVLGAISFIVWGLQKSTNG